MEPNRLVEVFRQTLVPEKQAEASRLLEEMHKIIGFVPALLNVSLDEKLEVSVRQAAAVCFKNNVTRFWEAPDELEDTTTFSIHEHDRQQVRGSIVAAIVSSPTPIQAQLKQALSRVIKTDYPTNFSEFPEQVKHYFSSLEHHQWHGALVCFHAFIKVYEFKRGDGLDDINSVMSTFFPLLYSALTNLLPNKSDESLLLQLMILKIFSAYIYLHFPCDAMDKEALGRWNDTLCAILSDFSISSDEPSDPVWKLRKWALRILNRLLTRYGSPGIVSKRFRTFAEWYMKSFVCQTLTVLLGVCELYRQKSFVSKSVLSQTLDYFSTALIHSVAWKTLRNHFLLLMREVLFPLLSHSEEDEELWQDDPVEYIRYKSTTWDTDSDPSGSAFMLLREACTKRRGVLNNLMPFCMHILTSDSTPVEKDAVFHMYGAIAHLLMKKKAYKTHLEPFVVNHVLPVLHAPEGYRRARACWLLGELAGAEYTDESVLSQVVQGIRGAIFNDPELPVRAFAALCMSDLLQSQTQVRNMTHSEVRDLFLQLLKLLRETEFDDLTHVIERLVVVFEKIIPSIAAEILQNLCETFMHLLHHEENGLSGKTDEKGDAMNGSEYRSIVATSILGNMESILQIAEDNEDLMRDLEPIVLRQIQTIFEQELSLFYEEALSLLFSLTSTKISPLTWQLFSKLNVVLRNDYGICFSEMMPCLHNFITVDREAFISDPSRVELVANMCAEVIQTKDQRESGQVHAAKLMEVLLLDFRGRINQYAPKFIEIALTRLTQPIVTSELRVMCIQVVVAGLLYSPSEVLAVMLGHNWPGTTSPVLFEFMKQWLHEANAFVGLHDRRLFVLGLCLLLSLPVGQRPQAVESFVNEYMPTLLLLFSGLKRAYATKAQNQAETDSDDDEDEDEDELEGKVLGSDEDEIDEDGAAYMDLLDAVADGSDADDDDDDGDDDEETILEAFETELEKSDCDMEEYVTFYRVMTDLEKNDVEWYGRLINHLTAEQEKALKDVVSTAVKCINQRESKMIERAGGYSFQETIPSNFDFSSPQ